MVNFILSVSQQLFGSQFGENDEFPKSWWETNKLKLANINFHKFVKYKQNATKVGYKR